MRIAVAGHVCADLTPRVPLGVGMSPGRLYDIGPITIQPGGCIVNVGRVLLNLGHSARLIGVLGEDDLGNIVVRDMASDGLDTSHIRRVAKEGTAYSIVIEPIGMNRSFWHHAGANACFDHQQVDLEGIDLLHVGYPSLLPSVLKDGGGALVALMKKSKELGITTSLDLAVVDRTSVAGSVDWHDLLQRTLRYVDIVCPSLDDLTSALEVGPVSTKQHVGELASRLQKLGVAVVMLTAGEDGLFIKTDDAQRLADGGRALAHLADSWAGASVWVPARESGSVITTNGAGDAAVAGLFAGMESKSSVREAAGLATFAASKWIQGHLAPAPKKYRPTTEQG